LDSISLEPSEEAAASVYTILHARSFPAYDGEGDVVSFEWNGEKIDCRGCDWRQLVKALDKIPPASGRIVVSHLFKTCPSEFGPNQCTVAGISEDCRFFLLWAEVVADGNADVVASRVPVVLLQHANNLSVDMLVCSDTAHWTRNCTVEMVEIEAMAS
jgi:hypothetical protein